MLVSPERNSDLHLMNFWRASTTEWLDTIRRGELSYKYFQSGTLIWPEH